MSEWIDTTNKNISTDKFEYHWNDKTCKCDCPYISRMINNAQFGIIKKYNAEWDKDENGKTLKISFSVLWVTGNKTFVLGLPTNQDSIEMTNQLIDKLKQQKE